MRLLCVIPARLGSTRLPYKPLRRFAGEALICHTVRRVMDLGLGADVVVATDNSAVVDAVRSTGVAGVMTSRGHASGTERVAALVATPAFSSYDVVLNVQGDEPFLPRAAAEGALQRVVQGDPIGTAGATITGSIHAPTDRVTVRVDNRGRALEFARLSPSPDQDERAGRVLHHLGVYAFTVSALFRWVSLPTVAAEQREQLEQLRPLTHGMTIGVARVDGPAPPAIDTRDDLKLAEGFLAR